MTNLNNHFLRGFLKDFHGFGVNSKSFYVKQEEKQNAHVCLLLWFLPLTIVIVEVLAGSFKKYPGTFPG
jgi:hypothetical protein